MVANLQCYSLHDQISRYFITNANLEAKLKKNNFNSRHYSSRLGTRPFFSVICRKLLRDNNLFLRTVYFHFKVDIFVRE